MAGHATTFRVLSEVIWQSIMIAAAESHLVPTLVSRLNPGPSWRSLCDMRWAVGVVGRLVRRLQKQQLLESWPCMKQTTSSYKHLSCLLPDRPHALAAGDSQSSQPACLLERRHAPGACVVLVSRHALVGLQPYSGVTRPVMGMTA